MGLLCTLRLRPLSVLCFFTLVNTLIYLDRGVISAILKNLASEDGMDLSESKAGALGSMFIFGFMVASPTFAYFSQTVSATKLVAVGLTVWSGATLMAGLAVNYWMLLVARAATGVGEASFVCLAPPLILDSAPPTKKTLWVSIFFSAMTLGYALGFIYGHETMTLIGSWRSPFLIESVIMLPLITIAFLLDVQPESPMEIVIRPRTSLCRQLIQLMKNPVYMLIVAGYSVYAFTIGGLAFWGNSIIQVNYGVSPRAAVIWLGSLTVFCGVVATVMGSLYMDYVLGERLKTDGVPEIRKQEIRTEIACRITFYSTLCGAIIGTIGAFFRSFSYFISALGAAEFLLFLGTGPVGMAVMSSVSPELRSQANAVSVFLMHLFGDFPSPYLIGIASQFIGMKWGIVILVSWLFLGALAWGIAWLLTTKCSLLEKPSEKEVEEETLLPPACGTLNIC